jgi:hypothetical protein
MLEKKEVEEEEEGETQMGCQQFSSPLSTPNLKPESTDSPHLETRLAA